jgi:hypothetical protein
MWQARRDAPAAVTDAGELWQTAVAAIYVEILAKSLVAADPSGRRDYWHYATTLVAQTLRHSSATEIGLSPADDGALLARWRRLAIDLPI